MKKKYIRDLTESGDYYLGTKEAWEMYHKAWANGDMEIVEAMETGVFVSFKYDPDGD